MKTLPVILLFLSSQVYACNCVEYSLEALSRLHIKIKVIPDIQTRDVSPYLGIYERGTVKIKDIENCHVMLHEFVHHLQWERNGDAKDMNEWHRREVQAEMVTRQAISAMSGEECK